MNNSLSNVPVAVNRGFRFGNLSIIPAFNSEYQMPDVGEKYIDL